MKELLQQTVVNEELIHCQKLLGKSKHIKKKKTRAYSRNPGQRLILRKYRHYPAKITRVGSRWGTAFCHFTTLPLDHLKKALR